MSETAQAATTPAASPEATTEPTTTAAPEAAPAEGGTPEVVQTWDGKLVVKINGKEEALDLSDPDIRERVKAEYQISKVGREEMRRAKQALKKIQQFEGTAKQNPIEALKMMGVTEEAAEKVFEEWYLKRREDEALPESEKKLRALERENMTLKEQQELQKKQEEESRIQGIRGKMRERLETSIVQAVSADPSLDKADPDTYAGILKHIALAEEHGYVDENGYPLLSPAEAIAYYKEDLKAHRMKALDKAKIEDIIEALGPERVKAIRNHVISEMKGKSPVIPRDKNPTLDAEQKEPPSKHMSMAEARQQALANIGNIRL